MKPQSRTIFLCTVLLLGVSSVAHAQQFSVTENCGSLKNGYGPFDYTDATHRRDKLPVVEAYHFDLDVFRLRKGMTGASPAGDIDYTLRAFPNHHRALDAMVRLHRLHNARKLPGMSFSLECYFDRARRMAPHDGIVLMIEGIYLFREKKLSAAEERLLAAYDLEPESAEVQYNLGLLYLRMGQYSKARQYAKQAYERGYPLSGLRDQLRRRDEWSEGMRPTPGKDGIEVSPSNDS